MQGKGIYDYSVGSTIPGTPYRVTAHIAAGGMGAVYEVEDTGVGKQFALKTLHAALAGNVATEQRMREEALTLGRLTHANVVQVFTAGVTKDTLKLPYIVMERLVGSTLRHAIAERGALGLRTTAVIALELLTALDEAHDLGLVHRDIKPDNVFLHRHRRGQRTTKLLDFGVADLVSKANEAPNLFFGTFKYASPEQLKSIPISQSSDLYSVGLVVYEMFAGTYPFAYVKNREELLKAQLLEKPKFPDYWPESVRTIIASALEKAPAARPKDAFTFAAKLRRAVRELDVDIDSPLLEEALFQQVKLQPFPSKGANNEAGLAATEHAPLQAPPPQNALSEPPTNVRSVEVIMEEQGEATTHAESVEVVDLEDHEPETRRTGAEPPRR